MKKFSPILAVLALVIGSVTLAGWFLNIDALVHPIAGKPGMNPVTAMGVAFCALSFLLLYQFNGNRRLTLLSAILALLFLLF